jgi:hypothetical protein
MPDMARLAGECILRRKARMASLMHSLSDGSDRGALGLSRHNRTKKHGKKMEWPDKQLEGRPFHRKDSSFPDRQHLTPALEPLIEPKE